MIGVILSLILPLLCFAVSLLLSVYLLKHKGDGAFTFRGRSLKIANLRQLLKLFLFILIPEWIVLLTLNLLVEYAMFSDGSGIPVFVLIITSAMPFAAALTNLWTSKERLSRFLKGVSLSAMVILAAETVIFGGKSFASGSTDELINIQGTVLEGAISFQEDYALIEGSGSITIDDVPKGTKALICNMSQPAADGAKRIHVWLKMKDDNFKTVWQTVQDKYTIAYDDEDCTFSFHPYGEVRSLQLNFDAAQNVKLYSVRAVSTLPFSFSELRYFVLLAVLTAIAGIKSFELYKAAYNNKKLFRKCIAAAAVLACVSSSLVFFDNTEESIEYVPGRDYSGYDIYVQVFDAFQKGQVYLDIEPAPELETLENVYDNGERGESGIYFKWDFAYYNGHYYSYFGVAPIFVLYYPYYWLTGKLPTLHTANMFFSVFAILFLCLTILSASKLLVKKRNFLVLLGCMVTSVSCVGVFFTMNTGDMYCLPLSSGLCFLFLGLYTGFNAVGTENKRLKLLQFIISGASLALCVASRPSMAVCFAVLLPFFIGILLKKQEKISFRISQAACFTVPVILGMAGIMWYNMARFDSPFDFGASYQLTVSDIHANKTYISAIPAALIQFFLQPLRSRTTFPFFEPPVCNYGNYGNYVYIADATSAMTYPFILAGMLLIPVAMRYFRKDKTCIGGVTALQRNSFFAAGIAAALFIAWQDFCMGGVTQRYIIDILPLMVLLSSIAILRCTGSPKLHMYRYSLIIISMAATVFISWMLIIEVNGSYINRIHPYLYDTLEDLLIFWR